MQSYEGKPVLTWWQGRIIRVGFGQGEDVIYNNAYQQIATVRAGNGYHADLHEILLTPQGTAWIDAFDPIHMNLASVHGSPTGSSLDSVIEEVDIKTGLVMWEWHALGHIPLRDSLNHVSRGEYPWDYVHINSISPGRQRASAGLRRRAALLAQHVDAVRREHAHRRLRLAARRRQALQLQARPGVRVLLAARRRVPARRADLAVRQRLRPAQAEANRAACCCAPNISTHTVTLVRRLTNPSHTLLASSQGNTLSLPGGDWLLGYGGLPNFTEFDASGHVLLDGTLGKNVQDFRTYLSRWSAQPTDRTRGRRAGGDERGRHGDRGGELERRHRRRLLAGARRRFGRKPRTARHRAPPGFRDHHSREHHPTRHRGACTLGLRADARDVHHATRPLIKKIKTPNRKPPNVDRGTPQSVRGQHPHRRRARRP